MMQCYSVSVGGYMWKLLKAVLLDIWKESTFGMILMEYTPPPQEVKKDA